ncbi:hypothetical protein [Hyphomicrobium sp.]|uniref:hypothetical protein n=1 Tax=Hyphomicrobium sp. TaxID=82 RepID=UPI003F6E4EC0
MRKNVYAVAASLFVIVGATSADARPSQGSAHDSWNPFVQHSSSIASTGSSRAAGQRASRGERTAYRGRNQRVRHARQNNDSAPSYSSSGGGHSAGGRPRAWCGWWMRTQRGGGAHLNLAWNWSKWGSPSGPQVGAVVVWRHHVGEIVGRAANGQWLVRSGNDGGAVRTRARSVSGAVFRVG